MRLVRLTACSAFLLAAAGMLCRGQERAEAPVFTSVRHALVVDTAGPYEVEVSQLAGPPPLAGQLRYTLLWEGRPPEAERRVDLTREKGGWRAGIPGQPTGTEVRYHFVFRLPGGATVSHPRRAPEARYRFRVLPALLQGVSIPVRPPPAEVPVAAVVRAGAPPSGALIYRVSRGGFDHRLPLTPERTGGGLYRLRATLPPLPAGTAVDLYFETTAGGSSPLRFPADAPARFFSYKVAAHEVRALTGGSRVSGVAATAGTLWAGLEGGGLLEIRGQGRLGSRRTLAEGLPSSILRSLAADPVERVVYAGTANGAVLARPGETALEPLVSPLFERTGDPLLGRLRVAREVDLAAVSPLDGSVFLRLLSRDRELEGSPPESLLLEVRDGRLGSLSAGQNPMTVTAMLFDEVDGCLLLAGRTAKPLEESRTVLLRRCGESMETVPLPSTSLPAAALRSIEALGRDPASGELALAASYQVERQGRPVIRHGVFLLNEAGRLVRLSDLAVPVTSLLPDWSRRRLLAGTRGEGLLSLENGKASVLQSLPCPDVSSLSLGSGDEEILVGTACGLYRLTGEAGARISPEMFDTGAVQPDLVPVDTDPLHGRALLLSAGGGLVTLRGERPEILTAGKDIPAGPYRDAAFDQRTGRIFAALPSRGLLRVGPDRESVLLTAADGLHGLDVTKVFPYKPGLLGLLFLERRSGPPRTGGLQLYNGVSGGRLIPLREPAPSSLRDLLPVPEREAVLAATRTGVLEIRADGTVERLSEGGSAALARDPRTGTLISVGDTLQKWDGRSFRPVTSPPLDHPRFQPGHFYLPPPLDVAIDTQGRWNVLHPDGYLAMYDGEGRALRLLDFEDGIPMTSRAVVFESVSGILILGTAGEGAVLILGLRL